MGYVELPDPPHQARGTDQESTLDHHPTEHECGCVSRNEYEQVRTIAKAVVACRKPGKDSIRDVPEEDCPVCEAPEQVQAQVPLRGDESRPHPRRSSLRGLASGDLMNGIVHGFTAVAGRLKETSQQARGMEMALPYLSRAPQVQPPNSKC